VRLLGRLPIEFRLALAFAAVMAVVLAATGAFVYLRLASELDETIDRGLESRAGEVVAFLREEGPPAVADADAEESFTQILDADGRVVAATSGLPDGSLLTTAELEQARDEPLSLEREVGGEVDEPARLLATPVTGDEELVAVVGASLEDRDEALDDLAGLLVTGGAVALTLASLAGLGVAASALRPVEAMRREAAGVSIARPGRRLPVPPTRDKIARLGETLNEMLARQEAAFAREQAFVSDASHELRTPLATLKAELEVALLADATIEETRASLASAAEETDRLAQLAEDLLVIARADQGRLPVKLQPVQVAPLFADVFERFRRRLEERGRAGAIDAPEELWVTADPLRLEQALGNMTDNALRHGAGAVTLRATRAGDRAELHVTDAGPGFPPDLLPRAFDRFTRGDESRTGDGTGLGLAIVDVIARAQGGTVGARTQPEGGADVWLELAVATRR